MAQEFQYEDSHLKLNLLNSSGNQEHQDNQDCDSNCDSDFDHKLKNSWKEAEAKSLFRYQLQVPLPSKVLPGKYKFLLQLNPDRAQKRRKPQEIQSVNQPFNPDEFNFNKVPLNEILFYMKRCPKPGFEDNVLLINVSPLEFGHVLITPHSLGNNPQKVAKGGLRLALEVALLGTDGNLRVGFNSLCGYASVNHEHYHAYYLNHRLYLENAEVKPFTVSGGSSTIPFLFELVDYPAPAFVFILKDIENEFNCFLEIVVIFTDYFQRNEIAHNIFITRGSTDLNEEERSFDSLRVYLWARESSYGSKECDAFNPALCELGGHFPCKNETAYETLTEEYITELLSDLCVESYKKVRRELLQDLF